MISNQWLALQEIETSTQCWVLRIPRGSPLLKETRTARLSMLETWGHKCRGSLRGCELIVVVASSRHVVESRGGWEPPLPLNRFFAPRKPTFCSRSEKRLCDSPLNPNPCNPVPSDVFSVSGHRSPITGYWLVVTDY